MSPSLLLHLEFRLEGIRREILKLYIKRQPYLTWLYDLACLNLTPTPSALDRLLSMFLSDYETELEELKRELLKLNMTRKFYLERLCEITGFDLPTHTGGTA